MHDTFSAWHPLFKLSAAFAELGEELRERGLDYAERPRGDDRQRPRRRARDRSPTATSSRRRRPFTRATARASAAEMARFGETIPTSVEMLGSELHSAGACAARAAPQLAGCAAAGRSNSQPSVLASARAWFETTFRRVRRSPSSYAPWALHTGLSPTPRAAAFRRSRSPGRFTPSACRSSAAARPASWAPSSASSRTLRRSCRDGCRGRADRRPRRARGCGARRRRRARSPPRGDRQHDADAALRPAARAAARAERGDEQGLRFRYSPRAGMQIHVALREPLRWRDSRLDRCRSSTSPTAWTSVSLACAQAAAGLLPASRRSSPGSRPRSTRTRAPRAPTPGSSSSRSPTPPAATPPARSMSRAAGRTGARLRLHRARAVRRRRAGQQLVGRARRRASLSPVELERRNPNLVRGDIYAGDCELDQAYLWRPLAGYGSHRTPVAGLYHCGASTYPARA